MRWWPRSCRELGISRAAVLKNAIVGAAFLGVLFLCGIFAYDSIFSSFAIHDDEGFVLISLKYFFKGHALYDQVYSCYQPFFYVFDWLVFRLWGATISHDSIRLLTIALWLLGASLNALMVYRLTSHGLLACLVLAVSINHLAVLTNEPGHPLGLSYVLIAAIVALFTFMDRLRSGPFFGVLGAFVGCLLLTKINLGVYVLLAVALVLAAGTPGVIFERVQVALGATIALLPAVLMHSKLTGVVRSAPLIGVLLVLGCFVAATFASRKRMAVHGTILLAVVAAIVAGKYVLSALAVLRFAVLATLSICGAVLVSHRRRPGTGFDARAWIIGLVAGVVAMAAVALFVVLRGTSGRGLLDGLVRLPLQQSTVFMFIPKMNVRAITLAVAGLASLSWYLWGRAALADSRIFHASVACAKLLFGSAVLTYCSPLNPFLPFGTLLPGFWMIPFLWLVAAVRTAASPSEILTRLAFVCVASLQPLGAYPVAGSQFDVATGLIPVIGAVCLSDAVRELSIYALPRWRSSRWWPGAFVGVVSIAALITFRSEVTQARSRYLAATPLALPGASRIRLSSRNVQLYQELVRPLARPEVETFLTLPGLNSLYFWAQKDPPTGFNVTAWMTLLDDRHQERIWESAKGRSGLMVVRNQYLIRFWMQGQPIDRSPLVREIDAHFDTVKTFGGYELMARR